MPLIGDFICKPFYDFKPKTTHRIEIIILKTHTYYSGVLINTSHHKKHLKTKYHKNPTTACK